MYAIEAPRGAPTRPPVVVVAAAATAMPIANHLDAKRLVTERQG